MPAFIDMTGQRYGRLIAKTYLGPRHRRWRCQCDCGNVVDVMAGNLRSGMTRTCGCIFRAGDPEHPRRKHGNAMAGARTPEYEVWEQMKGRCHTPSNKSYKNYGARGIFLCDRWRKDFAAFIADMGPRPGNGPREYSIERIDNNKGYEPGNCVWIPLAQQARNRRNNRLITHEGRTQYLSAWAKESKVSPEHLRGRLRDGWYFEDAIKLPAGAKRPRKRPRSDPEP